MAAKIRALCWRAAARMRRLFNLVNPRAKRRLV
jgi:hypothetical protein